MFELLIFFFITFGITQIIVNSTLFEPIRNFFTKTIPFIGHLINCIQCTGFWIGTLISFILSPTIELIELNNIYFNTGISVFLDGSISSGLNLFFNYILFVLMSLERNLDISSEEKLNQ